VAVGGRVWAALALLSIPIAARAARPVLRGVSGLGLLPVLRDCALTELCYAALLALGLAVSRS
jgi:1,4-dihydroxy-2-naphthoate polyprenyltransferase